MKLIKKEEMTSGINGLLNGLLSDDFLNWPSSNWERNMGFSPAVNISENHDGFALDMAVPGFQKDDFKIEMDNDLLTISAEVTDENQEEEKNFSRKEFMRKSFKRSFRLAEDKINQDDIKASYKDGVLSIDLPKKEEAKPLPARTISIS